jgi:hypothetical protein
MVFVIKFLRNILWGDFKGKGERDLFEVFFEKIFVKITF